MLDSTFSDSDISRLFEQAIDDTLTEFEKTGSPVLTDGEQSKPSFVTYPLQGLTNLDPEGMKIDFEDGHFRQLPLLNKGPFRYAGYASKYLKNALQKTKSQSQAVISLCA